MLGFLRNASLVAAAVPTALALVAPRVINKDIVVVGGGASGAHAAFRLREDYGKTVALIEKQPILVCICIRRITADLSS
jgi:heterodisulfide reductase subunit A-like polyferredoxin